MTRLVQHPEDRATTHAPGRRTRHAFSFGEHYDPANLGFGPLVCHNEDDVEPGHGYPDHPHTDLEIVTWVLSGALRHTDTGGRTAGPTEVVEPGTMQVMSAGSGVRHSETVDPASGPTTFVQVWVRPDDPGTRPWHRTAGVADVLTNGALVPIVSGHRPDALLPLGTRGATLYAARLRSGDRLTLPEDPRQHLYVARGGLRLEGGGPLGAGDAVRLVDEPGRSVVAEEPGEVLVWSFGR